MPQCLPAGDFLTPDQGRDVFLTIMLTLGTEGLGALLGAPGAAGGIAAEGGNSSKLLWAHWNDYPKVEADGQDYAQIGDRLWSRHAVDRMQPSGMRYSPRPGPDEGGKTGGLPQIFQVEEATIMVEASLRTLSRTSSGTPRVFFRRTETICMMQGDCK